MYVAVSILPKSVAVTQLTENDGQLVSTDNMLELQPGMKVGHVPYERLRLLGDGVHKLSDDDRAVPHLPRDENHIPWGGWLFFSVVTACAAFLGYWMFANWEAEGGRIRIHWLVALVYGLGGKWAVAGAFASVSVLLFGQSTRTWSLGLQRLQEKRQRLATNLAEIMDSTSRIMVGDYTTQSGLFVCHADGRLMLFVPVDFLTADEETRARKLLGHPQARQPNPDLPELTPSSAFAADLGIEPTSAAEQTIDVLLKVYGLHPYFDLSVHSHTTWSDDDDEAWSESSEEAEDGRESALPVSSGR